MKVKDFSEKYSLFFAILLSCFLAVISIVNSHGGFLGWQMHTELPFYLSDIPLLDKLFNYVVLDDGFYRARELSYFFDFIDAKFVEFSIDHGFPHFLSLTHYLCSIAAGCLIWSFCVNELKYGPLMGIGWLTLFWTSPCIFFSGYSVHKTGKVVVMLLTVILFYFLYKMAIMSRDRKDLRISNGGWFLYSIIILLMAFIDEQGLFLLFTMMIFLFLWQFFVRQKTIYIMMLICLGIISLHGVYRYFIAPNIIFIISGSWPDLTFQTLPIQYYFQNFSHYLPAGFILYLETFRFLIGNVPMSLGLTVLILLILTSVFILYKHREWSDDYRKFFSLALIGLFIINLSLVIMISLMLLRHPPLLWPSCRRVYYWLPTLAVLIMTLAIIAGIFYKSKISKYLMLIVMCLGISGNIIALPRHESIIMQGMDQPSFVQSSKVLLNVFRNHEPLNHIKDPFIEKNPVFQYFLYRNKTSQMK